MVKLPEEPKPGESASLRAETAPAIQKPIRPAEAQDTIGENQDFDDVEALLAAGAPKGAPPAAAKAAVAPAKTAGPAKAAPGGPAKTSVREKPSRFAEGEPAVGVGHGVATGPEASGINGKSITAAATAMKDSGQTEPSPPVPGSEALLPSADWSAERPWKSWLFLAVSILLGMGLAFGVVAFSLSFFSEETTVAVNPDQNPGGESKPVETVPAAGSPPMETETTKAGEPEKGKAEEGKTPAVEKEPVKPKAEKDKTEETKATPTPTAEEDPLGLHKEPVEEPRPASPLPANDPFSKFDNLLNNPRDPTAPVPAPAATVPLTPKPVEGPAEIPTKPSLPRPAPRIVNISTRMNDPLPGLKIAADEVALADLLQAMQDFSTIPITLELDNLAVFKRSADSAVPAFEGENLKFGAALTSVLTPLELEAVVEDDQIVVRKPELVRDLKTRELKLMTVGYAVGDLTHGDEKQAMELAEQAMALIEPGSWGDDEEKEEPKAEEPKGDAKSDSPKGDASKGDIPKAEETKETCTLVPGKDQFSIRHRLSAHVQFLTLIQKLRVARGLPLQGKGADPETFRLATRTERADKRLAAPISLTFNRPTPLVKICQNLASAGKVRILIDWRSIAPTGWNPDAEVTLVVDKKPLTETLNTLLQPMDLAYRVVDGRTIQIVSPRYLAEHLELELHPAKELAASQEQIDPLLARVRASLTEGAAESPGQLWFDPESKCLVAMLPQPKQQLLSKLLIEWKGAKETN